jgi:hypothetical protein
MSKIEVDAIDKQSGSTLTLGGSGTAVTLACGATQTGFGRTGTVDWDTTPKTATFSAVSGDGFFCNTTSGAFTCNLPAGSAGAIVSLADYAGTWQTNALTVSPNGTEKIGSVNADVVLNTEGQSVTLVYVDGTQGWINTMDSTSNVRGNPNLVATGGTITTSGNCKIHTFTGPGTFTVTNLSSTAANNIMSYVILAGGGGGGGSKGSTGAGGGSGAGAGGFREVKNPVSPYTASPLDGYSTPANRVTVTAQAYPITVGAGGTAGDGTGPAVDNNGANGSTTSFGGIASAGGGGGRGGPCASQDGAPGGSGGGASAGAPNCRTAGAGNTPPVTPPQGQNGGAAASQPNFTGAGGGGAGGTGTNAGPTTGGPFAGGAGVASSITASPVTRAAGGFGKDNNDNTAGPNRSANTGDGGPGGNGNPGTNSAGGNGGSGIVVIRYKYQ